MMLASNLIGRIGSRNLEEVYCTISVNEMDWPVDPEVALTVSGYVPPGVPFGFSCEPLLPLSPPQEHRSRIARREKPCANRKGPQFLRPALGKINSPMKPIA
jgi:hypothetical protein